ncbi:hypothetical protein SLEP1_g39830 [Rubroshorea leprosula]|uniref:Uncharacterized protein n=1 Tax=Rubroshorea leprosula TaxID=152421 RepID=A0AAV5L1I6_9ROSI|nr:hypothetical protein SLEP1_g39830 [Rubroshorea leprosula]
MVEVMAPWIARITPEEAAVMAFKETEIVNLLLLHYLSWETPRSGFENWVFLKLRSGFFSNMHKEKRTNIHRSCAVGACLGVVAVVAAMRVAPAHFWVRARQIEEGAEG